MVLIGASCCQVLVSGRYFSAVSQRLCPSYPPATYRVPPQAATPAPRRATDMGQMKDQRFVSGSHLQITKQSRNTWSWCVDNLNLMTSPVISLKYELKPKAGLALGDLKESISNGTVNMFSSYWWARSEAWRRLRGRSQQGEKKNPHSHPYQMWQSLD